MSNTVVALRRIYCNQSNLGGLGGVDRLLRRARELRVPVETRRVFHKFLQSEQSCMLSRLAPMLPPQHLR